MATCVECMHFEICRHIPKSPLVFKGCKYFADASLFIKLPCKVGDTIFSLVGKGEIGAWRITDIHLFDFEYANASGSVITKIDLHLRNGDQNKGAYIPSTYIGRSFFLTREEAEHALQKYSSEVEDD